MKKSIIALSLVSLFASPVFAGGGLGFEGVKVKSNGDIVVSDSKQPDATITVGSVDADGNVWDSNKGLLGSIKYGKGNGEGVFVGNNGSETEIVIDSSGNLVRVGQADPEYGVDAPKLGGDDIITGPDDNNLPKLGGDDIVARPGDSADKSHPILDVGEAISGDVADNANDIAGIKDGLGDIVNDVDNNANDIAGIKDGLGDIVKDVDGNAEGIAKNGDAIKKNEGDISDNKDGIKKNSDGVASNAKAINAVSEDLADFKFTAQQAYKQLDDKIDRVEDRVSVGVAMVGAMANVPVVTGQSTIGMGVANFNGTNALAVGYSTSTDSGVSFKFSGAYGKGDFDNDFMVGAGVGYSW